MPMMTGASVLAEMLEAYGTDHVFMVPAVSRRSMAEMESSSTSVHGTLRTVSPDQVGMGAGPKDVA